MANESLKSETFICESLIFKTLNIVTFKFVGVKFVYVKHICSKFEKIENDITKYLTLKYLNLANESFKGKLFICESLKFKTLNIVS